MKFRTEKKVEAPIEETPVVEKTCSSKEMLFKTVKQNLELASELLCFCNNCLDKLCNCDARDCESEVSSED